MKITPRHVVQLSSAEIAFLHALVQRQVRSFVSARSGRQDRDLDIPPPELVSLDRRLVARLGEAAAQEATYFSERHPRAEAIWISEEHAALAAIAARQEGAFPSAAALRSNPAARQSAPWVSLKRTRQHAAQ